jgi:DNA mismatch endonuclease, patch repair protein
MSFEGVSDARRRTMSAIRRANTKPELTVRKIAHRLGYRFRIHRGDLPGRPDLVFPSRRKIIFVHGCFWHQHPDPTCRPAKLPRTRQEYWYPKLARNVERDAKNISELERTGWQVLVIWECELADLEALTICLQQFLGPNARSKTDVRAPEATQER